MSSLIHLAPFAALLALLCMGLSINVVRYRWKHKLLLGVHEDKDMVRAVRAHANFTENTPMALLLVALVALLGGSGPLVIVLGALLTIGRISHAYSILIAESRYQTFRWRSVGMISTYAVMLVAALFLLWQSLAVFH